MSRPPLKDRSAILSKALAIRANAAERERWKAAAAKQGLTLSAWLRNVLDRAARTG